VKLFKVFIVVCLCLPQLLKATNYYVNDNSTVGDIYCTAVGSSSNSGTSASTPKRNLRDIWSLTGGVFGSGDIIYVDAGTYARAGSNSISDESKFDIVSAGLTVQGAGNSLTIFDNNFFGTNSDYFIWIKASNVSIKDLSVANYEGGAPNSGGTYNSVNNGAQAISIGGSGTINNVLLENLSVKENGGSGNAAITVSSNTQLTISGGGSTCNATGSVYSGGIDVRGTGIDLLINNFVLAYNQKTGFDGAGLYVYGNNTTVVKLYNSTIANNTGGQGGGAGIYINGGNVTVRNCDIKNNVISTSGGPYRVGAGIGVISGTLRIAKSKIESNTSSLGADFGGIGVYPSGGNVTLNIDTCTFQSNSGTNATGKDLGARIHSTNSFTINVNESTFSSASPISIGGGSTNSCSGSTFVITRSGNPSISYSGSPSCVLGGGSNTLARTQTYTTTPSSFAGTCGSITLLPIEFLDMRAVCVEDERQLIWSTGSEHNNAYFTIETGNEQGEFEVLTTVNGAGNSNHELTYQLPVRDAAYYRLSQTDYDGSKVELKTVSASPCKEQGSEIVYLDNLHAFDLYLKEQFSGDVEFALINSVGQVIERGTQTNDNNSVQRIFLSSFCSDGMYFLQVTAGSVVLSEKFMIRKQ
jgi:hypothetical protein